MKSLRKLLGAAIVVAMVLGTVGTGFAAVRTPTMVFTDIAGHPQESYILQTASLGIFAGYPDGTYRPDQEVTRAEFAKVVVAMLGLTSAADILKGTATNFPDVAADHWASGFINVAVAKGIIRGYPDGTFGPSDTILASQAVTMLIRALGYNEMAEATATWPLGEILTATNMATNAAGTTKKSILPSGFVATKKSTRGDIAQLVANATGVHFCTGKSAVTNTWTYDTDRLLDKLGTSMAVVADAAATVTLVSGVYKINGIDVAADAMIKGATAITEVHERNVSYVQKDGKIVYVELLPKTSLVKGAYTTFTAASGTLADRVRVAGVDYQVKATTKYRVNSVDTNPTTGAAYVIADVSTAGFLGQKPEATLILDANGKVDVMNIFIFDVTTTNFAGQTIDGGYITGKQTTVSGTGTVVNEIRVDGVRGSVAGTWFTLPSSGVITRNGATAAFADLKFGDHVRVAVQPGTSNAVNVDAFYMEATGYMTGASYDGNSGVGTIVLDGVMTVNPPAPATTPKPFLYKRTSSAVAAATGTLTTSVAGPLAYYNTNVTNLLIGDKLTVIFDRNGKAEEVHATQRTVKGFLTAKSNPTSPSVKYFYDIDGVQYEAASGAVYAFGGAVNDPATGAAWTAAAFYGQVSTGNAFAAALDQTGKLIAVVAFSTISGTVDITLTAASTSISVGGTVYTFASGVKFFRGGVEVARETITAGETVKLTLDSTGKVSQVVVSGYEVLTVANKSVYIKSDGSIAKAITFSDGTTLEIPSTVVFTLNGGAFTTHDNGFAAVSQGDAAKVTYDVSNNPTNIDLFRTVTGTITAVNAGAGTFDYSLSSPPAGWTAATVTIVPAGTTGATSVVFNGRSATFGAGLVGSTATIGFNAQTGKASSIVAKFFTVNGVVTGKSVVYGATGTATVTLTVNCTIAGGPVTVTFASDVIVVKDGATSSVDNILINDKIKADVNVSARYVEVTTP